MLYHLTHSFFTAYQHHGLLGHYSACTKKKYFLIDYIFMKFGGCLFLQVIGIPVGMNCAPLLVDLFLYSYESEFLDNMIRGGRRKLARSFNLCYQYIDDLIGFNNKKFGDYVKEIYPSQLTVEKANTPDDLTNYLDLTFIIESNNRLYTKLYDRRDDFDFNIVNFRAISHLALHMVFIFPS